MSFLSDLLKSSKRPSDQPSPYGDFGASLKGIMGYKGLYGTNQNFPGKGGYNYATPQAAAAAKAPAVAQAPVEQYQSAPVDYTNASGLSDDRIAEIGTQLSFARAGSSQLEPRNTRQNPLDYDVHKYFSDVNDPTNPLAGEDLRIARRRINDVRNDIAVGETTPYDGMDLSGFSPEDRRQIQKGYAEVYDPMLADVNGRIEYEEEQAKSADKLNQAGLFAGLDDFTVRQITNLTDNFDSNETTKAYRRLGSAVGAIMAIDPNTKNPADHQSIISAYAKALDPDSVVREGEYATVKKYSQGLADRFGGEIEQALKGTGFLSAEAIKSIQQAAKTRYDANKTQTDEYAKRVTQNINSRFGTNFSPEQLLIDYGVDTSAAEDTFQDPQTGQWYRQDSDGGATPIPPPSFSKVGGGTYSATGGVKDLADAKRRLARNESGGNYQILGPVIEKGQYKGEQALGKYQVMPGNLPAWSKEALGYVVTPQQFLANPQLQEAIVNHRLTAIYNNPKLGNRNWSNVASVWFTGRPLAQGAMLADNLGTTGQQYVNNFNA